MCREGEEVADRGREERRELLLREELEEGRLLLVERGLEGRDELHDGRFGPLACVGFRGLVRVEGGFRDAVVMFGGRFWACGMELPPELDVRARTGLEPLGGPR